VLQTVYLPEEKRRACFSLNGILFAPPEKPRGDSSIAKFNLIAAHLSIQLLGPCNIFSLPPDDFYSICTSHLSLFFSSGVRFLAEGAKGFITGLRGGAKRRRRLPQKVAHGSNS